MAALFKIIYYYLTFKNDSLLVFVVINRPVDIISTIIDMFISLNHPHKAFSKRRAKVSNKSPR